MRDSSPESAGSAADLSPESAGSAADARRRARCRSFVTEEGEACAPS
ncbi:MAG: hypothetical protein MUE69_32395 [Myxococcota bacterium]|nr:hypothetical protein [Myxococcota bacterium]